MVPLIKKSLGTKKVGIDFFRLKGMLFVCVYMLFNSQSRFQKYNWQLKKTSNFFQVLITDLKSAQKKTSETLFFPDMHMSKKILWDGITVSGRAR